MTSLAAAFPAVRSCFDALLERPSKARNTREMSTDMAEDARNRRACIHEMLSRNPNAFRGDADVQAMMQMYPGSF